MRKRQVLEAVFERGVFRPLTRPEISDGEVVHLTVDPEIESAGTDPLALATSVYDGLAGNEIGEIERMVLDRGRFFDRRPPE